MTRRTQDISDAERTAIRESNKTAAELAGIHDLSPGQIDSFRSNKVGRYSNPTWTLEEENRLLTAYEKYGWKPRLIKHEFPNKSYSQVYRKMAREIKGR